MPKNEQTSKKVRSLAAKGIRKPESLTDDEVQTISASALTQSPEASDTTREALPVEQFLDSLKVGDFAGAEEMYNNFNETEQSQIDELGEWLRTLSGK